MAKGKELYMTKKQIVLAICEMERSIAWTKHNILCEMKAIKEKELYIIELEKKLKLRFQIKAMQKQLKHEIDALMQMIIPLHKDLRYPGKVGQRLDHRYYQGDDAYLKKTKAQLLKLYYKTKAIEEQLSTDELRLHRRKTGLILKSGDLYDKWCKKNPSKGLIRSSCQQAAI